MVFQVVSAPPRPPPATDTYGAPVIKLDESGRVLGPDGRVVYEKIRPVTTILANEPQEKRKKKARTEEETVPVEASNNPYFVPEPVTALKV